MFRVYMHAWQLVANILEVRVLVPISDLWMLDKDLNELLDNLLQKTLQIQNYGKYVY